MCGRAVPWDIAGRILVFFAGLCAIKLVMLTGFRVHLYEIHWRLDLSRPYTWVNRTAFFVLAALVAAHLWRLGNRCAADGGVKMVRSANACALVIAAFFIFLTLQAAGTQYFCALMEGTGTAAQLKALFFSEPPYLSFWLLLYAMFYFLFARLKLEHLALRVTGVMAALYMILLLWLLSRCRDAVIVADCFGIACLLCGKNPARALNWYWLALPVLCLPFFILIFIGQSQGLIHFQPEFLVMTSWMAVILAGTTLFAWRRNFYAAWSWLLPFAVAACLLLVNVNYDVGPNYQYTLAMGLMLPHYFIGEFALAALLAGAAILYRRFLPSASLLWLDVIILLLMAFALADLRLSQIMGVRLDWQAVKIAGGFAMMWRQAGPYLPDMAFGLVMLVSIYAVVIGLLRRIPAGPQAGRGACYAAIAFLLLAAAGRYLTYHDKAEGESAILLAQTSPLFQWNSQPPMDEKTFVESAKSLHIDQMFAPPAATPSRSPRDLNVVFIFQESSYNKYLSLFDGTNQTEPLLSKYKDRMELFPNFFSSFPGSINARFAALSGLYPVRDYEAFTFHHVGVKSILDILHEQGYVSSVFASDSFDYTDFRDFLRGRGADTMYDAATMPGREGETVSWGVEEGTTMKAIQAELRKYAGTRQKFFLSYFPVAPHNPFDGIPPQFQKFPVSQKDFVGQYQNSLLYLDWVIASIVDELKNDGLLDKTLVVITDDHGEMLGEKGGPIGHGWAITPWLTNIPLIIMDPGNPGYRINDTVGSQVDLLPTILDLLGIPVPPDQVYEGVSLYSPMARERRVIYLNSFEQYGVLDGRDLLCGNRETEVAGTNSLSLGFYTMTNSGPRTIFSKMSAGAAPPPSITEFDHFQENFLQNYGHYTEMIRGAGR